MPWNPDQYNKFQTQRSAPFDDLLNLILVRPGLNAVDLGCGTGELTEKLASFLPDSNVIGYDNSQEMLDKAVARKRPGLNFVHGDQAELPGKWNLIFSNAALQWSENHAQLIPFLYEKLDFGGQITIQVPSNHTHVSHKLIFQTAQQEPFKSALNNYVRISPVLTIEQYAQLFFNLGAENIIVFEKVYCHVLNNSDEVVEWVSGTALVPYFERLGTQKLDFLEEIRRKFRDSMPDIPLFYPFKRILISAQKPR